MHIGSYQLKNQLILAPMAGISDRPFRELCIQFGAGLAVSEMVASNPALRQHKTTRLKMDHGNETGIRSVQILGTDPQLMAEAALFNAQRGAQIIDINMGCPAKKVCSVAAGSALMRDEALVKRILDAVVNAVDIPVTLKIRTGWDLHNRNAVAIAKIAEQAGIAALTVHGRTRACKFEGRAEHDTVKQVKQTVAMPVIANGDITSPEQAQWVLASTGADAIMIGRGAQGNPWLFSQINHFIQHGKHLEKPTVSEIYDLLMIHLGKLYSFYGSASGVKIARKHIAWYLNHVASITRDSQSNINQAQCPSQQIALINSAFNL
ncbi:MAG: tRNA dihydrouridine synthase DusB [Methylobacter sp.]|nr:tRNA dihydrouridine synthase DusB [Methylobacter sp.]MDP2428811.1 tRNA dihydrouridine synthase DusB [Methylobacter sp.]MDP3054014.1 tRNA dihydrouridine synthase DusB [Methylobacter sp.]MDP3361921.1 tRNA dihydrouridine synthase DusB [Methylobacter sp.]MDZ4219295.1 tRNA dihydrouridine synthase DusB [Methylobacter sp.]